MSSRIPCHERQTRLQYGTYNCSECDRPLRNSQELFKEVILPDAVHNEIMQGGKDFVGLGSYRQATWIKVQSPATPVEPLLGTLIDKGEAAVIHLDREWR